MDPSEIADHHSPGDVVRISGKNNRLVTRKHATSNISKKMEIYENTSTHQSYTIKGCVLR